MTHVPPVVFKVFEMRNNFLRERTFLFAAVLFAILCNGYIFLGADAIVHSITREDSLFENLTACFYVVGIFTCLFSIFKKTNVILACLWLFLCVLFLGEETSWFQRYLGYSVPAVESLSAQNEFNLHNLYFLQGSGLLDSSAEYNKFINSQNIFRIGFFGYFLLLPLLYRFAGLQFILGLS